MALRGERPPLPWDVFARSAAYWRPLGRRRCCNSSQASVRRRSSETPARAHQEAGSCRRFRPPRRRPRDGPDARIRPRPITPDMSSRSPRSGPRSRRAFGRTSSAVLPMKDRAPARGHVPAVRHRDRDAGSRPADSALGERLSLGRCEVRSAALPFHLSPQELGDRSPTAETLPRIVADQPRSIAQRDVPRDKRRVAARCGVEPSPDEVLKLG
jgi:hypothetical protein